VLTDECVIAGALKEYHLMSPFCQGFVTVHWDFNVTFIFHNTS